MISVRRKATGLLRLLMLDVFTTERTVLLEPIFLGVLFFVACRGVVAILALRTLHGDYYPIHLFTSLRSDYSKISVMTPAPTVRPPSRMANRNSFSIAIGVIKATLIVTLSPGITISTPSGNVTSPVTSVVLK